MKNESGRSGRTYINPVYKRSFPDPFVLKHSGEYFAFCTGVWTDGRVFGVLRSPDLVTWTEIGGAMERLETDAPFYWAPEVTYHDGKFYLYYSVGNETLMELRVAVSDRPDGGYVDSGHKLTAQDFAIDAHVFTDDDGSRYLFYATDFLEHTHIGTGTVVDRMIDSFTLEGNPKPVTRARYDWQVYDPARKEKGGVRWHTVEGPFVLKRKGVYFEMFSGGNWQNTTYGVSFAMTHDLKTEDEWVQFCDGETVLPILRTLPGEVVGPGHNSVVRGPNNRELYCVYHSWTDDGRVLSIDRMDFAGDRIFIKGPTTSGQPEPYKPTIAGFAEADWTAEGSWNLNQSLAKSESGERSRLKLIRDFPYFLCEFGFQVGEGIAGFELVSSNGRIARFGFVQSGSSIVVDDGERTETIHLPGDFTPKSFNSTRIYWDGANISIELNGLPLFKTSFIAPSARLSLFAENGAVEFAGFELTEGFQDLFEDESPVGWESLSGSLLSAARDGELELSPEENSTLLITKGLAHREYESAINLRTIDYIADSADYGVIILDSEGKILFRISLSGERGRCFDAEENLLLAFTLPGWYMPQTYFQFRLLILSDSLTFEIEGTELFALPSPGTETRVAIYCTNTSVFLEMARLTVL